MVYHPYESFSFSPHIQNEIHLQIQCRLKLFIIVIIQLFIISLLFLSSMTSNKLYQFEDKPGPLIFTYVISGPLVQVGLFQGDPKVIFSPF